MAWSRERLRIAHVHDLGDADNIAEEVDADVRSASHEFADALYTLVGHALTAGVSEQQLLDAIGYKVQQNDNKSLKTHEVVTLANGARKVQRKGRRSPHVKVEYDAKAWDE